MEKIFLRINEILYEIQENHINRLIKIKLIAMFLFNIDKLFKYGIVC